jgi:hypothetical protein
VGGEKYGNAYKTLVGRADRGDTTRKTFAQIGDIKIDVRVV